MILVTVTVDGQLAWVGGCSTVIQYSSISKHDCRLQLNLKYRSNSWLTGWLFIDRLFVSYLGGNTKGGRGRIGHQLWSRSSLAKSWNTRQCQSTRGRTLCSWPRASAAECAGLGDTVLLWLPIHAGAGEVGKVRQPLAVLCRCTARRDLRTLPTDWSSTGTGTTWPGWPCHAPSTSEQRLPGVRFLPAVIEKKIPDTPAKQETMLSSTRNGDSIKYV